MSYRFDTRIINGKKYLTVEDYECIIDDWKKAVESRDKKIDDWKKALESRDKKIDSLRQQLTEYKGGSKYEHMMNLLDERTRELALQNKEVLNLRDTIEALRFDRDDARKKLAIAVEQPVSKVEYMKQRVNCELCGKDLSRNSLRGHMETHKKR